MKRIATRLVGSRAVLALAVAAGVLGTVTTSRADSFTANDKQISAVVGFGLAGIYGDASQPVIGVEYNQAINPNWSLGGVIGRATSSQSYNYFYGNYSWKYTYTVIAARGAYHFVQQIKNPKLDGYVGATLGYNDVSASYSGPAGINYSSASASYALYGIYGGGTYAMSPKWGWQAELGYGVGYLSAGVYWKL